MSDETQNQDRIHKLEESVGFQDHTLGILSNEVTEINKLMIALSRRLAALESRLSEIDDRVGDDPGNVPPPHSAGPDIPKDPL